MRYFAAMVLTAGVSTHAVPAFAVDGVREINQTCAVQTGCWSGDGAGFPVTIGFSGSFVLTSNLHVSDTSTTAIDFIAVQQQQVTLDLNGFEISGPVTCTGSGATLNCGAVGTGHGVNLGAGSAGSVVRNGIVRGMGASGVSGSASQYRVENISAINNARDGIGGQGDLIIENCTAIANGEDGFDVDEGSIIVDSTAVGNGNDGFEVDGQSAVIRGVSARGNGSVGINAQAAADVSKSTSTENASEGYVLGVGSRFVQNTSRANGLSDACGGGICSSRRRFYLTTTTTHNGAQAPSACASGFHMASLWELHNVATLTYDVALGQTFADSGDGPPAADRNGMAEPTASQGYGWIRTGNNAPTSGVSNPGLVNCDAYTNSAAIKGGTVAALATDWDSTIPPGTPLSVVSPWKALWVPDCTDQHRVWCAEDEWQ